MNKCIKYVSILIILMAFAAIALPASTATPNPTDIANTTENSWVNHTWKAGDGGVTDSYNISVNDVESSITNRYWKDTYTVAHAWQNITVYAFNNTGGKSTGFVAQNTQIPNNPITITNISNKDVTVGATVQVDCEASDADDDIPKFSCNKITDLFTDFDTETGKGKSTSESLTDMAAPTVLR